MAGELMGKDTKDTDYYCLLDPSKPGYAVRTVYRSDLGRWSRWDPDRRGFIRVERELEVDLQRWVFLAGDIDLDLVPKARAIAAARSLT